MHALKVDQPNYMKMDGTQLIHDLWGPNACLYLS